MLGGLLTFSVDVGVPPTTYAELVRHRCVPEFVKLK
jgi:hypothetical protein